MKIKKWQYPLDKRKNHAILPLAVARAQCFSSKMRIFEVGGLKMKEKLLRVLHFLRLDVLLLRVLKRLSAGLIKKRKEQEEKHPPCDSSIC